MIELKQTDTFRKWREKLKDARARSAIASRLDRLAFGHVGDAEPVGKGVSELRINYGPVTGCISSGVATRSTCCFAAVTKDHKRATSRLRCTCLNNGANDHDRETDELRSSRGLDH